MNKPINEEWINAFLRAVGECRSEDLQQMLAPNASIRWITPGGTGEKADMEAVVDRFRSWFAWLRKIEIVSTNCEDAGGRYLFSYRFRVQQPDGGWYTVRQMGVLDADDDGISAIDIVCTGLLAER